MLSIRRCVPSTVIDLVATYPPNDTRLNLIIKRAPNSTTTLTHAEDRRYAPYDNLANEQAFFSFYTLSRVATASQAPNVQKEPKARSLSKSS